MATDTKSATPRPFDVKTIEHLITLMAQHELSEILLAEGEHRIRLRKGGMIPPAAFLPTSAVAASATAPSHASPTHSSPPGEPTKPTKTLLEIKSPMVGTFYAKPSPDKPDYVTVGSRVTPTTVVCKLEAMKIFNDLTADVAGTITEVCVQNAQAVDYGTVLFRVDPS